MQIFLTSPVRFDGRSTSQVWSSQRLRPHREHEVAKRANADTDTLCEIALLPCEPLDDFEV
jgi:hypothetical protein